MQQIKTGDVIQNFRILSPSDDVEMIALHDTPGQVPTAPVLLFLCEERSGNGRVVEMGKGLQEQG